MEDFKPCTHRLYKYCMCASKVFEEVNIAQYCT